MATAKKTAPVVEKKKVPIAEVRKENEELKAKLEKFNSYGYCYMCDTHKDKSKFYVCTNPAIKSEITPICKECARKIALRVDKNGQEHEPTKDSVKLALRYLDKPFLDTVWNASIQESENLTLGKVKHNVWYSYIKNIQMINYVGMTYAESDMFRVPVIYDDEKTVLNTEDNKDVISAYEQNQKDAVRLLGYDPFVKESVSDQPFLYANLIGYLDASEDANEDRMRVSSIIEIVKGFNHIEKLNDIIAKLMSDISNIERNIATIKNLEETKTKITSSILKLAQDNGISLKHSVNSSKGENTWTGKVRKLKEMNLREQEVNLYDAEYSAGLAQVADISNAAIIKQLRFDENDYTDMITQQRDLIKKYKKFADDNEEKARILFRENNDLKDLLKYHNIPLNGGM